MYRQSSWPSSRPEANVLTSVQSLDSKPMFFWQKATNEGKGNERMASFTRDIVVLDGLRARFSSVSNALPRLGRDRQAKAKVSKWRLGEGDFCEGGEWRSAWRLPVTLPVASFKSATNIKQFSHPWTLDVHHNLSPFWYHENNHPCMRPVFPDKHSSVDGNFRPKSGPGTFSRPHTLHPCSSPNSWQKVFWLAVASTSYIEQGRPWTWVRSIIWWWLHLIVAVSVLCKTMSSNDRLLCIHLVVGYHHVLSPFIIPPKTFDDGQKPNLLCRGGKFMKLTTPWHMLTITKTHTKTKKGANFPDGSAHVFFSADGLLLEEEKYFSLEVHLHCLFICYIRLFVAWVVCIA